MRSLKTKRFDARTVAPTLFGPPTNSSFSRQRVSSISPSAAPDAAPKSAPSADIRRIRKFLADMVLNEDVCLSAVLADEVYDGLDRVCRTLDYLAGKQHEFEFWTEMKAT